MVDVISKVIAGRSCIELQWMMQNLEAPPKAMAKHRLMEPPCHFIIYILYIQPIINICIVLFPFIVYSAQNKFTLPYNFLFSLSASLSHIYLHSPASFSVLVIHPQLSLLPLFIILRFRNCVLPLSFFASYFFCLSISRGSALCSPVPMFPGTYVPRFLCSAVPMFPDTDVPRFLYLNSRLA